MNSEQRHGTKRIALLLLTFLSLLYLGQGAIYWTRLSQLEAKIVDLSLTDERCDDVNCTATWSFVADGRFILLGHILRTHVITDVSTGQALVPISKVRGTSADSWASLRVYAVDPGKTYEIRATKYKSIKMGYFIGVLPRITNHEGILSIPDISPTISTISGLALAFILCAMFGSALLGGAASAFGRGRTRGALNVLAGAAFFAAISAFLSLGILDTLLPEGDARNKVLRVSALLALSLPLVSRIGWLQSGRSTVKLALAVILIAVTSLLCWPWIRGGATWAVVMGALTTAGVVSFSLMKHRTAALVWSTALIDSAKIFGIFTPSDYPPVYFANVAIFFSLAHVMGELGGYATISLAGVAYRRFRRDLVLNGIQSSIEAGDVEDSVARVTELRKILPDVADLTGAGRVTVTISLPLGRPITQSYDASTCETAVFDDGKIPGAVTLRCLVYGDEAMFESFEEFAQRVQVPRNPSLIDAGNFCAIPLRVNQTIVGTLMLTGFNDESIRRQKAASPASFMLEDRETIHLVAERISQSLSKLIVRDLNATATLSRTLQASIHKAIAASAGADDFLERFAFSVKEASGLLVMIHERSDDKGVAVTQAGINNEHWQFFVSQPFNLSMKSRPAYGPTVVAFRDGKSSYVKDIMEILNKMHPKTVEIMAAMQTMSVLAVPLKTLQRSFVITLMSSKKQGAADPAMVSVLEATEALFVAAVEVMSQKTSVLALGQLASRLIGDDEVREKILDAAKNQDLPTTIGSPRTSFLLLFDLAGSSDLSEDTEIKARAYGQFYDAVNRRCQEILGGLIRKTIGDAVIVTWDGTNVSIADNSNLLDNLCDVVSYSDEVAKSIGCKGSRAILHYGSYFLGLVGTQTFGQIDVIGSGIDEVCKMEGQMKTLRVRDRPAMLAISTVAVGHLPNLTSQSALEFGFVELTDAVPGKLSIQYAFLRGPVLAEDAYVA